LLLLVAAELNRSSALLTKVCRIRSHSSYGCRVRLCSGLQLKSSISITCETSEDIEFVGSQLSNLLEDTDVLLLRGDLGAGKTTLTRGLIRSKFNDPEMMVTSPSYLLDNCYQYGEQLFIHHMDLYRLPPGCDMGILDIPHVFSTSICIIEWPDRMSPELIPESYLGLTISIDNASQRRSIQVDPRGKKWNNRVGGLYQLIENISNRKTQPHEF